MCPLFVSSWHPSDFYEEALDFKALTLNVIANPGSEKKPKTFEEGALLYYDTYFTDLTTFTIPTVELYESFSVTKQPTSKSKKTKRRGTSANHKPARSHQKCPSSASIDENMITNQERKQEHNIESKVLERSLNVRTLAEATKKLELHHIPDDDLNEHIRNDVIADRKGKRANKIVASMLEKWGIENGEKMMLMTELKFHDNSNGKLTKYNGDFDVFVISQKYGILFFQVKGVEVKDNSHAKTISEKISEARKQTLKDVAFLRESNRDLSFILDVSVHTFVAVPNLTEDDLHAVGICRHHRQSILCGSDMDDITTFSAWMASRLSSHEDKVQSLSKENYRIICSRYIALVAKVNYFPSRAVVINKTKGFVSALNYGNKGNLWAILTPEQLKAIYDQELLKIITGEFGTGKSLVVVTKAKQLAMSDCFVYLLTFAGVGTDVNCYHQTNCFSIQQLRKMMGHVPANIRLCQISDIIKEYQKTDANGWTAITGKLLEELFDWMVSNHSETTVHVLCDEVPCYMFQVCHRTLIHLAHKYDTSHLWLVLATHSHKPTQFKLSDTQWFKAMMGEGYSFTPLLLSMRIPANVYQMVQIIRGNEDQTSAKKQRCGHVVDGPKPLVFVMPKCHCYEDTKRISVFVCNCLADRMAATVKKLFWVLDPTKKAIECSEYSILIGCFVGTSFQHDLCTHLREAFRAQKRELIFNLTSPAKAKLPPPNAVGEKFEEMFNVYDRYTYIGCENSIIIDIDPYALNQCGAGNQWTYATMPFTRTVSQYVLFTWPKDEAYALWNNDLRGHDELTDNRVKSGQITEEMRDIRYNMTARARLSRGECFDKLISCNAVVVHPVSLPTEYNAKISRS